MICFFLTGKPSEPPAIFPVASSEDNNPCIFCNAQRSAPLPSDFRKPSTSLCICSLTPAVQ